MEKKPRISIILPNYNHSSYLENRLESIINQTFQDFEIILLDDYSTDNSVEILKEYLHHPKVSQLILNEKNSGSPFRQWKKGISFAKGEYVWIAESDDWSNLEFLEKIFNYIEFCGNLDIVYSQSVDVDENGKSIKNRIDYTNNFEKNIWKNDFSISGRKFVENYLKVKNVIPNASAVVFKRNLVGEKTFSEDILNMKMCGDWLFWIKLCRSHRIGFISDALNYFRNHNTISRNHFDIEIKRRRLLEEAIIRKFIENNLSFEQNNEVKKLYLNWFRLFSRKEFFHRKIYKILITKYSFLFLFCLIKSQFNAWKIN